MEIICYFSGLVNVCPVKEKLDCFGSKFLKNVFFLIFHLSCNNTY